MKSIYVVFILAGAWVCFGTILCLDPLVSPDALAILLTGLIGSSALLLAGLYVKHVFDALAP